MSEESKTLLTPQEIDLLEEFCRFLEKAGYIDCDWYSEKPTAIVRFSEGRK